MRKLAAPLLAVLFFVGVALPALATEDILQTLSNMAQQEQAESNTPAIVPGTGAELLLPVPDVTDVQMDVDLEAGTTEAERLASYVAGLETKAMDFETLAKKGIAYGLQGKHERAKVALEQALATEPGAQSLYDLLAKALVGVAPGLKVYVNGKPTVFDVQPVIIDGRTLVPIRAVAEQLGAKVTWDEATKTATIMLGPNQVEVTRDSTTAKVNGQAVTLQVAATIIGGRTMLPLRFVSESLNEQVDYHAGATGTAVISVVDR